MKSKINSLIKEFPNEDITEDVVYFINKEMLLTRPVVAKAFGVSTRAVSGWEVKGFEASKYSLKSIQLYNLDSMRSWHKKNISQVNSRNRSNIEINDEENEEANVDLELVSQAEADRRKAIESVKKLQFQNKILDGENISIDDVDKNLATQAATHISHLTNSEKILPDLLENKSASDIQEILNDHNQMSIEQLHRTTNKEISGEHELYDVFQKILDKYDGGADIETIMEGVDKI